MMSSFNNPMGVFIPDPDAAAAVREAIEAVFAIPEKYLYENLTENLLHRLNAEFQNAVRQLSVMGVVAWDDVSIDRLKYMGSGSRIGPDFYTMMFLERLKLFYPL